MAILPKFLLENAEINPSTIGIATAVSAATYIADLFKEDNKGVAALVKKKNLDEGDFSLVSLRTGKVIS